MKARILTAILLMSALTTFAQTSRRETSERRNNDNNNNSTTNVEQRTTDQRNSGNNANQEKKSTVTTNNDGRTYSQEGRAGSDERRNNPSGNNGNNTNNVNERRSTQGETQRNNSDERKGNGREYSGNNERRGENPGMREGDHGRDNRNVSRDNRRDWNHSGNNERVVVRNRYDSHPRRVVIVDRHYTRPANRHVITYRAPVRRDIFWSVSMSRDFRLFYPEIHTWRYTNGYRVPTIPAYDAWDYAGEVAHIYGRVQDIYFEPEADEFYLYFGDFYPRQDLTIVIPGNIARQFSGNPFRYFQDQYISASGYIQMYDGRPEMLIRSTRQMDIY